MTGKPFNPPAFPCEAQGDRNVPPKYDHLQTGIHSATFPGMTLRDYFAGHAMAAIIAKIPFEEFPEDFSPYEKTAIGAYDYADAMLTARESTS